VESRIIIIAGPNGAGKTTFAKQYLPREAQCPTFINVDLIAAGISPFDPDASAVRAGRVMLAEIRRHLASGQSFAFETTLSGRSYATQIPRWQAVGYRVELIFLKLSSVRLALSRVKNRVKQGGHHVPASVVRRRFHAGWRYFNELYRPLVNRWVLYDNAEETPRLIDQGSNP
jgi:predicted ABC-type ATPase